MPSKHKKKKNGEDVERGGHNAEFCELCTPFLTARDPRKGCHGEQTAFFGREAQSDFSLLPVNLCLMVAGTGASLSLPWDTSCFLETLPLSLRDVK